MQPAEPSNSPPWRKKPLRPKTFVDHPGEAAEGLVMGAPDHAAPRIRHHDRALEVVRVHEQQRRRADGGVHHPHRQILQPDILAHCLTARVDLRDQPVESVEDQVRCRGGDRRVRDKPSQAT